MATQAKASKANLFSLKSMRFRIGVILAATLLVFLGVLTLVQHMYETSTYWVLNTSVPAYTRITPSMLSPVTITKDTQPKNALDLSTIQNNTVISKYALNSADILTASNTTGNSNQQVPDSWVITSFTVNNSDAVAGAITKGSYFDLMVATPTGSFYPFVNLLAYDVASGSGSTPNATAGTSGSTTGTSSQYVVAVTPQNAAKLQQLVKQYGSNLKLVLHATQNNSYQAPPLASYSGVFKYDNTTVDGEQGLPTASASAGSSTTTPSASSTPGK